MATEVSSYLPQESKHDDVFSATQTHTHAGTVVHRNTHRDTHARTHTHSLTHSHSHTLTHTLA